MAEPVSALGRLIRELAAEHGSGVTRLGTLFVRVTNHGNEWALEFSDEAPIDNRVLDEWAIAVGVPPNFVPTNNKQHTEVRLSWQGTEEPAPAGPQAFYLGGKR